MSKSLILIIDDDADFSLMVKMNLESMGNFEVIISSSSKEGLVRAQETKPDLILLDLVMPGIDGFEALKSLKKNPGTKDIPVVMLTVKDDEVSKLKALQLYSEAYITKPIGADELKAVVDKILEKQKDQKELLEP
ncbi:MAG: response regulator [Candidatus Omnitrophica bacterium]|nr:response regulator [Candidatus Omnitrophota bacterium]